MNISEIHVELDLWWCCREREIEMGRTTNEPFSKKNAKFLFPIVQLSIVVGKKFSPFHSDPFLDI